MNAPPDSHYDVLGIAPGASAEEVERAYRDACLLYCDDALATYSLLEPGERDDARARVEEAFGVLRDPGRRRAYDVSLGLAAAGGPPAEERPPEAARTGPVPLPDPVSGPELKRFRESLGIPLRDIAAASKVGVRFLEYIEAERVDALPATVYLRGFVQEYARAVGLDPRPTAESYLSRLARRR